MLKIMSILSTATIKKDRMKGCDLPSENEMKKMSRGNLNLNSRLVIVRWYDNKSLNVCSNYANPEPFSPVKMGSSQQEAHKYKLF